MYTNEKIAAFLTLRSQGLSYDKIAKELNVSKHTLLDWAREYRPPIDVKLQAALETYHAAFTQRVEILAREFQLLTQTLSTCDRKSSSYPRLLGLLLKFHQTLQELDFAPGSLPAESTKTAPSSGCELKADSCQLPLSTKSAPTLENPDQELRRLNTLINSLDEPNPPSDTPERTEPAPESESSSTNSCLENVLVERMRKRLEYLEAKIAS